MAVSFLPTLPRPAVGANENLLHLEKRERTGRDVENERLLIIIGQKTKKSKMPSPVPGLFQMGFPLKNGAGPADVIGIIG